VTALRAVLLLGLLGVVACKENIPRPPDDPEDSGVVVPTDVSSPDGPQPAPPDVTPDTAPVSTCGAAGQPCCPGNGCAGGGCCVSGLCVANGTACRTDATCLQGSCGGCGALLPLPQACCEPRTCTASRAVCLGPGGGTCQACGAAGQSCCGDGFCESGFTCDKNAMSPGLCIPK
jgi:hypothetical protein